MQIVLSKHIPKVVIFTDMEEVRSKMAKLDVWAKNKWWTAVARRGKKIAHHAEWAKLHDIFSNSGLVIEWVWNSGKSPSFLSALEVATANSIPSA